MNTNKSLFLALVILLTACTKESTITPIINLKKSSDRLNSLPNSTFDFSKTTNNYRGIGLDKYLYSVLNSENFVKTIEKLRESKSSIEDVNKVLSRVMIDEYTKFGIKIVNIKFFVAFDEYLKQESLFVNIQYINTSNLRFADYEGKNSNKSAIITSKQSISNKLLDKLPLGSGKVNDNGTLASTIWQKISDWWR